VLIGRYFLPDLNQIWGFLADFHKKSPKSNFMEVRPMGAEFINADRWADRRTDMTKIMEAFREYATDLKK
jgi:hypothetical protein